MVGTEERAFFIHKDLLCYYSSYFRGALNGNFLEATTRKITLDDEKPNVFAKFAAWLYTGFHDVVDMQQPLDYINNDEYPAKMSLPMWLWVFADKRGIPLLQNYCIARLHTIYSHMAGHSLRMSLIAPFSATIYANTTPDSKLRRFFLFWAPKICRLDEKKSLEELQEYGDLELLHDIMLEMPKIDHTVTFYCDKDASEFFEGVEGEGPSEGSSKPVKVKKKRRVARIELD